MFNVLILKFPMFVKLCRLIMKKMDWIGQESCGVHLLIGIQAYRLSLHGRLMELKQNYLNRYSLCCITYALWVCDLWVVTCDTTKIPFISWLMLQNQKTSNNWQLKIENSWYDCWQEKYCKFGTMCDMELYICFVFYLI